MDAIRNWIAVASAEHVRRGREEGFMQICHGKAAPLRRIRPGERVAYYSPTVTFGGKDKCQTFTAIGRVRTGDPYCFDMGNNFVPFRKDVDWLQTQEAPIQPLLDRWILRQATATGAIRCVSVCLRSAHMTWI
jgi:EVE domain